VARKTVLRGKTPDEFTKSYEYKPTTIGANTKLPDLDYIPDGNIIIIRFIRSDKTLSVFGENFQVSKDLVYSYVKAVIVTEIHTLQIYLGEELVEVFDYQLPV